MSFALDGQDIDPNSQDGQKRLALAHRRGARPICRCRVSATQMYIAHQAGRFLIKRMPGTGAKHAPDCTSFEPPAELSGLGQVKGCAIEENAEDGTTVLKLDFALGKSSGRKAPPPPSDGTPTEVTATPKKLTLTSLLHYLWHEADLDKWVPAMDGKRWWGVVQRALLAGAEAKITKGFPLASRLFIPEPYHPDRKTDLAAKPRRAFAAIANSTKSGTPYGVLIAEYKDFDSTRLGAKFRFKHLPDCPFFADEDFLKKFNKVFDAQLALADMVQDAHIITIATFSIAKAGYPVLSEMGMMLVTDNWIPFEHLNDLDLIVAMKEGKRSFIKSLRYNLPPSTPIASMVATDLRQPVSMFVRGPGDSGEAVSQMVTAAEDGAYPAWLWIDDGAMPELPREPRSHE